MLYGGVKEAPNVSVEYQAADQILSFYVALESLPTSRITASLSMRRFWGKGEKCPVGRPDTQAKLPPSTNAN